MPPRAAAAPTGGTYALSDSEDELLDELFDSEEEDEGGNDKKPKKKKPSDIASILRGALPEPSHATINTKHLHGESNLFHHRASSPIFLPRDRKSGVEWEVVVLGRF